MDLGLEIKGSKLVIKWQDVKADCYRVFLKNDGNFCECARVSGETEIRLSIVPYGDGECFVVAVKDGLIIDKSSIRQFTFDTIDVVSRFEGEKEVKFFYSKYDGAQGYRLYKSEAEQGFGGCKNSDAEFVSTEISENTEYKIKPFIKSEEGRTFLASSQAFKPAENVFKSVSVYKSFNYNLFLSWNYAGYADGFEVFSENSKTPIFEVNDGLRHYLELFDYKGTTKFIVKAFVLSLIHI